VFVACVAVLRAERFALVVIVVAEDVAAEVVCSTISAM
jgi:hypothetical protein